MLLLLFSAFSAVFVSSQTYDCGVEEITAFLHTELRFMSGLPANLMKLMQNSNKVQ